MGAQQMRALDLTTAGTLVETLEVLQSFTSHLAVSLLHVRGLLLRHSPQDRLPDVC